MTDIEKYLALIDDEIAAAIDHECQRGALSEQAEHDLHILFENRKHAVQWGRESGHAPTRHAARHNEIS